MIAAIRVRGRTGIKREIEDTLKMLHLTRINHAVIVPDNPSYQGMLRKAKDYITWGEIDKDTLTRVIEKRGRLPGNHPVTPEYLQENTDYKSMEDLSQALLEEKTNLEDIGMKPVFRLHPPRKGYRDIRKSYREGGTLGYRGDEITNLLGRMI